MLFRDESRDRSGGLYRSRALRRVLEAICDSERCRVKSAKIPPRSVQRVVLYAGGSGHALPGSSPEARRILHLMNIYLKSVDTCFYHIVRDATQRSFYLGEVEPHTHLSGRTGALFTLDPRLSMHTTMMLSPSGSGPPAEYHEFQTNAVLVWTELPTEGRNVVCFSSSALRNRFYLFYSYPRFSEGHPKDRETGERWNKLSQAIEEAVASVNVRGR